MVQNYNLDGRVYPADLINDLKLVRQFDNSGPKADVFLDTSPDQHDPCPNCGGSKGKGRLYAPTGDKCKPYHMGGTTESRGVQYPLRRALRSYRCPVCTEESYQGLLVENSGLPLGLLDKDIWPHEQRSEMEAAVKRTLGHWTTSGPRGWLTLLGPFGIGKTFLAQWLGARLVSCGIGVIYADGPTLSTAIFDTIDDKELSPSGVLERYRTVPVLIIDQLDWLRPKNADGMISYDVKHLLGLLEDRYAHLHERGTVLILNRDWWLAPGQQGTLAAVVNRAKEGEVVEVREMATLRKTAGEERRLEWWHD